MSLILACLVEHEKNFHFSTGSSRSTDQRPQNEIKCTSFDQRPKDVYQKKLPEFGLLAIQKLEQV